jgi:hypothetical protein
LRRVDSFHLVNALMKAEPLAGIGEVDCTRRLRYYFGINEIGLH